MIEEAFPKSGILRAIKPEELDLMRRWRNAPNVRANMYTQHEIGEAEHRNWWSQVSQDPRVSWLMYESGGVPQGIVYFTDIAPICRNAAWGLYAAPAAPRGTGSKMAFLVLDHAFAHHGLHKLYCEVLAYNVAAVRLYEKFGFTREGIFREQFWCSKGFVDIHRFGMLTSEWAANRPALKTRLQRLEGMNPVHAGVE